VLNSKEPSFRIAARCARCMRTMITHGAKGRSQSSDFCRGCSSARQESQKYSHTNKRQPQGIHKLKTWSTCRQGTHARFEGRKSRFQDSGTNKMFALRGLEWVYHAQNFLIRASALARLHACLRGGDFPPRHPPDHSPALCTPPTSHPHGCTQWPLGPKS
jgi:hypothetical protein